MLDPVFQKLYALMESNGEFVEAFEEALDGLRELDLEPELLDGIVDSVESLGITMNDLQSDLEELTDELSYASDEEEWD